MPILGITVPVYNPENDRTVVLNRGTDVPREVVVLIDRPGVWASEEDAAEAAALLDDVAAESDDEVEAVGDGEPPRAGSGSGRDAWAKFAIAHHVPVDDEDKRDDIIAKLADAGVIDE